MHDVRPVAVEGSDDDRVGATSSSPRRLPRRAYCPHTHTRTHTRAHTHTHTRARTRLSEALLRARRSAFSVHPLPDRAETLLGRFLAPDVLVLTRQLVLVPDPTVGGE